MEVNQVDGVKVHFPSHSLKEKFEARIKVYYADDPGTTESDDMYAADGKALATPIVMLGPHGVSFMKDVTVQLPLPDCDRIIQQFGVDPRTSLTIYHSSTHEDEPVKWESCPSNYTISEDQNGLYTVMFPVRHFSWYKAVWDILASTVNGAKIGVSYFYPYIRFSMMCMAMMDETADTKSFGLEVSTEHH